MRNNSSKVDKHVVSGRNKRKIVYQWLQFLKDEEELVYPIHRMQSNLWFKLFEQHHQNYDTQIFKDQKYFCLHMNNIIDAGSLPYLTREVHTSPYRVFYILDTSYEVIDISNTNATSYASDSNFDTIQSDQHCKFNNIIYKNFINIYVFTNNIFIFISCLSTSQNPD